MSTLRQEKVSNQLKQLAALFIEAEGNGTSLITVTDCSVSPDMKQAKILITVLPTEKETDTLNFLKRKRKDLRDYVKKKLSMKIIPFFDIEIDLGEKNRQHIEDLLREGKN